jgi:hypothetical protein
MPLAKIQPQFGKGRIVSEKITFEMPSTMKYTSSSSVSTRRPAPRWRIKSTPTITDRTTETS